MNHISRKSLIGAVALAATLAAPLAFAQSTDTAADPAAQPTPTAQDSSMAAGASGQMSWDDIDTDMSGDISKTEAAAMPALSQVFDQADTDADGALTAEEYQNYVAQAQSAPPQG